MSGAGPTILVVDDEAEVRAFLQRVFAGGIPGARVLLAANGADALALLRAERVDLVVSDQRMPGMTGIEFLAACAAIAPDAPRILLTGYADVDTAVHAKNDGHVSAFLQKPASRDAILAEVRRRLDEASARLARERAFARAADALRRSTEGSPR